MAVYEKSKTTVLTQVYCIVCLGQFLARIELRLAVARFFLAFPNAKVSSREGMSDKDMDPRVYVLLIPAGARCLIEAV